MPTLRDVPRKHGVQARKACATYVARVTDENSILPWLSHAAKAARKAKGRLQSHVAAEASLDQSTINRFEKSPVWSENTGKMADAYADDLEIARIDLWKEAVRLWDANNKAGSTKDPARASGKLAPALKQGAREAGQPPARQPRGAAGKDHRSPPKADAAG